jgi:hypothetical protein
MPKLHLHREIASGAVRAFFLNLIEKLGMEVPLVHRRFLDALRWCFSGAANERFEFPSFVTEFPFRSGQGQFEDSEM